VYGDPFGKHTKAQDLDALVEMCGLCKLGDVLVSAGFLLVSYIFGQKKHPQEPLTGASKQHGDSILMRHPDQCSQCTVNRWHYLAALHVLLGWKQNKVEPVLPFRSVLALFVFE
jgi:hypothetical protein